MFIYKSIFNNLIENSLDKSILFYYKLFKYITINLLLNFKSVFNNNNLKENISVFLILFSYKSFKYISVNLLIIIEFIYKSIFDLV